jgi:phosphoadenosine phosphosulfate reductase
LLKSTIFAPQNYSAMNSPQPPAPEVLAAHNAQLQALTVEQRLHYMLQAFPGRAAFSTSLGLEDQVLTAIVAAAQLPVYLFTLDTGRLFQETHELLDATRTRYRLPIEVLQPDTQRLQEFVTENGTNSFYQSVQQRKLCCHIRKVEPLQRALQGATLWITGLRAAQSEHRYQLPFLAWDALHQVVKFNPLLDWSLEQVQDYVAKQRVPVNVLHAKGYPSIGCAPCTRAVADGEDIRSGRWWWETAQKECGLHSR